MLTMTIVDSGSDYSGVHGCGGGNGLCDADGSGHVCVGDVRGGHDDVFGSDVSCRRTRT